MLLLLAASCFLSMGMANKILLFIGLTAVMSACSRSNEFKLKAQMKGLSDKPILVVYDDPVSKIDTIYQDNGSFTYTLNPDTLQLFRLVADSGLVIPMFADKKWHVDLQGTFANPSIKGDGPNDDYHLFLQETKGMTKDEITVKAEEFIRSHPNSYASAYLLEMYFVQVPDPDYDKISDLIEPMDGSIKDTHIVSAVIKTLQLNKKTNTDYVSVISQKDRNGKSYSWNTKENFTLTLVNFWASWDERSVDERKVLKKLIKEFKPEEFRILNISLDYSRKDWDDACVDDTLQWIEMCDFKGWDNALVKQMEVKKLPANFLVNRSRKVLASDLHGKELKNKILRLIADAKSEANDKEEKQKIKTKTSKKKK